MTAEELAEVPGIGEKTVEKISIAVRHYFGQYEEGEARPVPLAVLETPTDTPETRSMSKTPEELIAEAAAEGEPPIETTEFSTEDIIAEEEADSASDANDDADARAEAIELDNDTIDSLVAESQEVSDETIDSDEHDRG
jgi:N utilization substance protein A